MTDARDETGVHGWFARLFRRSFHTPDHPDTGFFRAVAVMFALGIASLAVGLGALMDPHAVGPASPLRLGTGIVIGPMFLVFGVGLTYAPARDSAVRVREIAEFPGGGVVPLRPWSDVFYRVDWRSRCWLVPT